jgi:hypothetical protein
MQNEYEVIYRINVDARTSMDAAIQVEQVLRDMDYRPAFEVTELNSKKTILIDLEEDSITNSSESYYFYDLINDLLALSAMNKKAMDLYVMIYDSTADDVFPMPFLFSNNDYMTYQDLLNVLLATQDKISDTPAVIYIRNLSPVFAVRKFICEDWEECTVNCKEYIDEVRGILEDHHPFLVV